MVSTRTPSALPAALLSAAVLASCSGEDPGDSGSPPAGDTGSGPDPYDQDADGYRVGEDCNDLDAAIHPGATEVCNDLDDDCDGLVDDEDDSLDSSTTTAQYLDGDHDGYGDPDDVVYTCELYNTRVLDDSDCDDADPTISPDAQEDCFTEGADLDCDGLSTCADDDCGTCPEDCEDGADNDADGLTDCEDADCTGESVCEEVCGDGLDNDADGATDCEDDACWGTTGCDVVRARVDDGYWGYTRRFTSTVGHSTGVSSKGMSWGRSWMDGRERVWASATSVVGTAFRQTSAGTATCTWRVGLMSAYLLRTTSSYAVYVLIDDAPTRFAFATSGACDGLGSSVLPATLSFGPAGAFAPTAAGSVEWYEPSLTFRTSDSTRTRDSGEGWSSTVTRESTSAFGLLTPASSFVTVLP